LELEELPGVQPIQQRSRLGLYHTAFLLPTRAALSSFVKHLWKLGMPFGAGDHWVSEAIYLVDPDGLEVEVYADRPRAQWSSGGLPLRMGTEAVRFDELARVTDETWHGAPAGTTVGHIHLYVGDLHRAADFYVLGLGLDIMLQIPTALFASAGGYHHHVGLNVWAAGSPVASERDARLLFWELVLPDAEEVQHVAESLLLAGYAEAETEDSTRRFADAWGIVVELAVSC
jgi:catechol 2,3-dioxygenase